MIHKLNYSITWLLDKLLYPFSFISDFWGVLFLSVLVSLVVLVIYKYVSSPSKIKDTKNKIKSNILAIRLYKDFWKVIVTSFFKSLLYTLKYFTLNFGPILLIIPLIAPIFFQMDIRYGMRAFEPGENLILKAEFTGDPKNLKVGLMEDPAFTRTMNPVFIHSFTDENMKHPINEVNWKLKITNKAATDIKISVNETVFSKSLVIGDHKKTLSNKKFTKSNLEHFFYPAESLLKENPHLLNISIRYPGKTVSFLGINMHWIIWHLLLVVIIVLALKKRFGVEF